MMKELNYGADYKYAHDFEGNFVEQDFLPEELKGHTFYRTGNNARENEMRQRLQKWWKKKYDY